jgi:opacity protein-like surface antigen
LLPAETLSAHYPIHLSGGRMKKLRIIATLILALAAAACSASPTAPSLEAPTEASRMDGTGFLGGGTRMP